MSLNTALINAAEWIWHAGASKPHTSIVIGKGSDLKLVSRRIRGTGNSQYRQEILGQVYCRIKQVELEVVTISCKVINQVKRSSINGNRPHHTNLHTYMKHSSIFTH